MVKVHSEKLDLTNPIKPQQKQKDVQQKEKQKGGVDKCLKKKSEWIMVSEKQRKARAAFVKKYAGKKSKKKRK